MALSPENLLEIHGQILMLKDKNAQGRLLDDPGRAILLLLAIVNDLLDALGEDYVVRSSLG